MNWNLSKEKVILIPYNTKPIMAKNNESHWSAFVHAKCPHCHHGDMFVNKNPYALGQMSEMHLKCPVCNISFFPETGFYWGSMYMSYVLTVMFSAVNVVLIGLISGWNMYALIVGNAVMLIIAFPIFFRYSRVLWLQLNMPFDREIYNRLESQPRP
jgi:hypothetical protein